MEEIMEYESFKTALRNILKNSNRTKPSKHTRYNYRAALKLYLQFVNSEKGSSTEINPDDLIVEAQQDIEKVKVEDLEQTFDALSDRFEERVKEIAQKFDQRLADFYVDYQAEMSDASREVELPEPTKEEIGSAKKVLSKKKEAFSLSYSGFSSRDGCSALHLR